MGEILKNNELPASIDTMLDVLMDETSLHDKEAFGGIKESGKFYMLVYGQKLDLPFASEEKLIEGMKAIDKMIFVYSQGGYNGKKLYAKEDLLTRGDISTSRVNIYVDNGIIFDTTFFSSEGIQSAFGIDPSRTNIDKLQGIADFLNTVLPLDAYHKGRGLRYAER